MALGWTSGVRGDVGVLFVWMVPLQSAEEFHEVELHRGTAAGSLPLSVQGTKCGTEVFVHVVSVTGRLGCSEEAECVG